MSRKTSRILFLTGVVVCILATLSGMSIMNTVTDTEVVQQGSFEGGNIL